MGVLTRCVAQGMAGPALSALMLSIAGPALGKPVSVIAPAIAAAPAAAASAIVPRNDGLLVTGLPSIIEYPNSLWPAWLFAEAPACAAFWVRSLGLPTPALKLTTTGMAEARLLDPGATLPKPGCPGDLKAAATTVALTQVEETERPMLLVLPADAFPAAAAGAKGKLLVLREGWPVREFPLTLRRDDYPLFVKALLWFLGIATPAIMTALIGLRVYKAQKRTDADSVEKEALARFVRDQQADLKAFFAGVYKSTMEMSDAGESLRTLERELGYQRIPFALPGKARERLFLALRTADRKAVAKELAKAFPEHESAILKPVSQELRTP